MYNGLRNRKEREREERERGGSGGGSAGADQRGNRSRASSSPPTPAASPLRHRRRRQAGGCFAWRQTRAGRALRSRPAAPPAEPADTRPAAAREVAAAHVGLLEATTFAAALQAAATVNVRTQEAIEVLSSRSYCLRRRSPGRRGRAHKQDAACKRFASVADLVEGPPACPAPLIPE